MRPEIFKANDVRGRFPEELDEASAGAVGYALARFLLARAAGPVLVARDTRASSESLSKAVLAGLACGGADAVDIGLATTPMLYFGVNALAAAGGVMVTASHNPAPYNGFKLVREEGIPIGMGSGLETIRDHARKAPGSDWQESPTASHPLQAEYVEYFRQRFKGSLAGRRRVVADCVDGVTEVILPHVLAALGIEYVAPPVERDTGYQVRTDPLGTETLRRLQQAVRTEERGIGVAFDGDGDRVFLLDEEGTLIPGDLITALLAKHLLKREGSHPILYDLRSSRAVPSAIRAYGGRPVRMRVGHAFMKLAMREHDALLGGELSGHYYFRDFFYCESGILAMLEILRILEESGTTLKEAISPFRRYAHSGEINFRVRHIDRCIAAVGAVFSDGERDTLDGLTVTYPSWWFNLRPSCTEPLLRLNLEAETSAQLDDRRRAIEEIIMSHLEAGPRE